MEESVIGILMKNWTRKKEDKKAILFTNKFDRIASLLRESSAERFFRVSSSSIYAEESNQFPKCERKNKKRFTIFKVKCFDS